MLTFEEPSGIHGVMASFENVDSLVAAAGRAREEGYEKLDAYSPFPVDGLSDVIGLKPSRMPIIVLTGALIGTLSGIGLQYFCEVLDYPKNIGGRPLWSWPAFVPAIFELTILLGSFSAVIGMLLLNGLPQPYHPVFNVPQFRTASRDGFFLCIEAEDPNFDLGKTRTFLETLNPIGVYDVER